MDAPIVSGAGSTDIEASYWAGEGIATRATRAARSSGASGRWERRRATRHSVRRSVKVMDMLTNRFYAGVVRNMSESGLLIELANHCPVQVGQRVRFLVTNNTSTLARRASMRSARVVRYDAAAGRPARMGLQVLPDFL